MSEYPKEISKEDRFDWFPCEPTRLLGALAGMKSPKKLTYLIVLLRIYEEGGACPDTVDAIALRVGLNKRVVTDALSDLCKEGRLHYAEGGIHNWKADVVIADSIALRERRKSAGANGGKRTAEKSKQKQQKQTSKAAANEQPRGTQEQLQEQDSLFSNENRVPAAPAKLQVVKAAKPEPVPVPDDGWPEDHVEQFWQVFPTYRLAGKAKVAEKLTRLRRDKTVAWEVLIEGVRRYAATNPGEYASGPMPWLNGAKWDGVYKNHNGGTANGQDRNVRPGPRLGFAGIAASIRARTAESAASSSFFADAGDHEPSDGRRPAEPPLGSMDRDGQAADVAAAAHRR